MTSGVICAVCRRAAADVAALAASCTQAAPGGPCPARARILAERIRAQAASGGAAARHTVETGGGEVTTELDLDPARAGEMGADDRDEPEYGRDGPPVLMPPGLGKAFE